MSRLYTLGVYVQNLHYSSLYTHSPVCTRRCVLIVLFCANLLLQILHSKGRSPLCARRCLCRLDFLLKLLLQWWQWNLFFCCCFCCCCLVIVVVILLLILRLSFVHFALCCVVFIVLGFEVRGARAYSIY